MKKRRGSKTESHLGHKECGEKLTKETERKRQ